MGRSDGEKLLYEVCSNNEDDDGDGDTDEEQCFEAQLNVDTPEGRIAFNEFLRKNIIVNLKELARELVGQGRITEEKDEEEEEEEGEEEDREGGDGDDNMKECIVE